MDKKRWWLWEWPSGEQVVCGDDHAVDDETTTEVQLAPVDAVVCERGTREWAVVMAMRARRISVGYHKEEWGAAEILLCPSLAGWHELPAPWAPRSGKEVRWVRGKHTGTGTYVQALVGSIGTCRHEVSIDRLPMPVDSVSPMEEARDGE